MASNKIVTFFVSTHLLFAIALGRLFAFAPDEQAYVYTFNYLYGPVDGIVDQNPQIKSGWIAAPKAFLWISYLPAKVINLAGVPDYLSIRILSISVATISLILIKNTHDVIRSSSRGQNLMFIFLFTPSVFLWSSLGLRESFVLFELTLLFKGFNSALNNRYVVAIAYTSLGSFGLLSTKSYLFIPVFLSMVLLTIYLLAKKYDRKVITSLIAGIGLIPIILFASTSSWTAVQYMFVGLIHVDPNSIGARSGDSVASVNIIDGSCVATLDGDNKLTISGVGEIVNGRGKCTSSNKEAITVTGILTSSSEGRSIITGTGTATGTGTGTGTGTVSILPSQLTFHGDTTLVLLHTYFLEHPNSPLQRILNSLGLVKKFERIWDDKVALGLVSKGKEVYSDNSSINSYTVKAGNLRHPLSVIMAALRFLLGPFPLLGHEGIALSIIALESPLWWCLYLFIAFQLVRYRKFQYYGDPSAIFISLVFLAFVAFSAMAEVNLGTSFRHRSIILIPLIFLYLRVREKTQDAHT